MFVLATSAPDTAIWKPRPETAVGFRLRKVMTLLFMAGRQSLD
jgi:hypothetical protein